MRLPIIFFLLLSSCSYKFNDVSVPADVKTVNIRLIENNAAYINPQLTPNLTDRLRQKFNNQTKMTLTNSESADWIISGQITDYSFTTVGVTSVDGRSQSSVNRLNVTVSIQLNNQKNSEQENYTASRQFDFPSNQSIQQAERVLLDEMVRNLTDEIFNRLFSKW